MIRRAAGRVPKSFRKNVSRRTPSPSSPPATTRHVFPGKPLADLVGRPMIEHVYRRAAAAPGVDAVVVATDDARIERGGTFGGIVRMTSPTTARASIGSPKLATCAARSS